MSKKVQVIEVQNIAISISKVRDDDFICLTDMAKAKEGDARAADIIKNWVRNRSTLEFLGTWEQMYNPDFKVVEFDHFKMQAGLPSFVLSPSRWVGKTNAIGIYSQSGRYGGTYAHKVAQKELQKKWLMQNLLTRKKRLKGFNGEWKKLGAGEIFKSISIKGFDTEELLSATQDRGIIPRSMLEGRVTMPTSGTESYKLVEPGDFVVSLRSFQGGLEYSYYKGIVSPAYTILKPKKKIDDEFFKQYFKSNDFIGHLAIAVIGIRDGKQISYDDFCTVRIPYPSPEEQTAIAKGLQAADKEIQFFRIKTEKLREQKKGLMQVLLTGKKRLTII